MSTTWKTCLPLMSTDTSTNTGWPEEKQLCEQPHPDSRRGQDTYSEKLELTVFPTSVFISAGWCRDSPAPDKDLLLSFLFLFPAILWYSPPTPRAMLHARYVYVRIRLYLLSVHVWIRLLRCCSFISVLRISLILGTRSGDGCWLQFFVFFLPAS